MGRDTSIAWNVQYDGASPRKCRMQLFLKKLILLSIKGFAYGAHIEKSR